MDATNLRVIGFSHSAAERSVSTSGGKIPRAQRNARASHPARHTASGAADSTAGNFPASSTSSDQLYFLLGYFPVPGNSYFFTFSVDTKDSLSMDRHDPMHVEGVNRGCTVLLSHGAVAYCGTAAGAITRWNIRTRKIEGDLVDPSLPVDKKTPYHGQQQHQARPARTGAMTGAKTGASTSTSTTRGGVVRLGHRASISCLVLSTSRADRLLVSGSDDETVKVWSVLNNQLLSTLTAAHSGKITSVYVDPSEEGLILSAADDQTLTCWQKSTTTAAHVYRRLFTQCLHGNVTSLAVTSSRQRVVALLNLLPISRRVLLLLTVAADGRL